MAKRRTTYKLRLKVEEIEAARQELGLTQTQFADLAGIGVSWYREVLRETRAGHAPNVTIDFVAGILSALGWRLDGAVEQVVA